MKTIIVKTQAEMDILPEKFEEFTVIEIRSKGQDWMVADKHRKNSSIEARGNSRVMAQGNGPVVERDNSIVMWQNSAVVSPRDWLKLNKTK